MKNFLYIVLFSVLVCGCAKYEIVPQNISSYSKGIKILQSHKQNSKVQVELAQANISDDVLVVYVGAELLESISGQRIDFNTNDIRAFFDNNELLVFPYERLFDSEYNFIKILQYYNIPTPTPSVNQQVQFNVAPFYYYAYPGFLYYPPLFSPFFIDNPQSIAFEQEKRGALKVFLMNYLRKTTLTPSNAQGGFVAISKKHIKQSGTLKLEVQIGADVHIFLFDITKR